MIMSDDKKKKATLIIAKMKGGSMDQPKPAPTNEAGDEMDSSMGYKTAAEEILKAVESKDATALMSAMKSFYDMCSSEEPSSEE